MKTQKQFHTDTWHCSFFQPPCTLFLVSSCKWTAGTCLPEGFLPGLTPPAGSQVTDSFPTLSEEMDQRGRMCCRSTAAQRSRRPASPWEGKSVWGQTRSEWHHNPECWPLLQPGKETGRGRTRVFWAPSPQTAFFFPFF